MGMYFEGVPSGMPEELVDENFGISVPIDYSSASQAAADTFVSVATSLCPVRTGNLAASISAGTNGNGWYGEATASYAQYVEFGTSRMAARPFMAPAIEAANAAYNQAAEIAITEAQEQLDLMIVEMVNSMIDDLMSSLDGVGGGIAGLLIGFVITLLTELITTPIRMIEDVFAPGGPKEYSYSTDTSSDYDPHDDNTLGLIIF